LTVPALQRYRHEDHVPNDDEEKTLQRAWSDEVDRCHDADPSVDDVGRVEREKESMKRIYLRQHMNEIWAKHGNCPIDERISLVVVEAWYARKMSLLRTLIDSLMAYWRCLA
jgi:hypothetical protein